MKVQRVLLLGGTGAMGEYLQQELLSQGIDTFVTSRQQRQSDDGKLHFIQGNAKDHSFLTSVVKQGFDVIVDFMVWGTAEFKEVYRILLNSTDQYIFVSSYRVFAEADMISETSPKLLDVSKDTEYLATDEYALSKMREERLLTNSRNKNYTIVRPSITYSKRRFQLCSLEAEQWVWRAINGYTIALPEPMLSKMTTMTWAKDVARLMYLLMGNGQAFMEDFNVVTAESHQWDEVLKFYEDVSVNNFSITTQEVSLQDYESVIGAKYQIKYDRMLNRVMDNTKIIKATGFSQSNFTSLKKGLASELADFLDDPIFKKVSPGINGRMDRLTSEWGLNEYSSATNKIKYFIMRTSPKFLSHK